MLLTRELAQEIVNREPKVIKNVPEMKCDVRLRALTGPERLTYLDRDWEETTVGGIRAMVALVILSVIDENGKQTFTDDDEDLVMSVKVCLPITFGRSRWTTAPSRRTSLR